MSDATTLRLFVYGTLKRGQCNHVRYFGGNALVQPATVRGRLVLLRQGYPMLIVPPSDVLLRASADLTTDIVAAESVARQCMSPHVAYSDASALARGELVTVTDPERRLPPIDVLEDFDAATGIGLYTRILLCTVDPPNQFVWTYVAPDGRAPSDAVACGAEWP